VDGGRGSEESGGAGLLALAVAGVLNCSDWWAGPHCHSILSFPV
jgi:hypothetical protein